MKEGYRVTIDAPQQVPTEESRGARHAVDLVLIVLGAFGVLCAIALVVLSTIGQQAAVRAHPDAEVTGVVVVNGYDAACLVHSGDQVMDSECPAAAVRINGSTNTDAFPLDSMLTITAPNDMTIGAEYHGFEQVSALPRALEMLAVPAVFIGFGGVAAIVTGIRRRRRRTRVNVLAFG
jgi:hypothetical protein